MNYIWFGALSARGVTRNVARQALGCVAASKPLEKFLLEQNPNVLYLPTGVNSNRFRVKEGVSDRQVRFLWTGQIWGKVIFENVCFLVECLKRTLAAGVDGKLIVVGRGKWLPRLKARMASEFPGKNWEIREWVQPDDMPTVIRECDVGLVPLIPDRRNREWMMCKSPTKLFEYMACGIPSVATPSGDAAMVLRHGTDGFLAGTAGQFSDAMILLAKDKERRLTMGRAARQHVEENYSLNALGARLEGWVREVIGDQKHRS